jgi:hypothetical protein
VETLDRYFSNVCELDLMFHLEMASCFLLYDRINIKATLLNNARTPTLDFWLKVQGVGAHTLANDRRLHQGTLHRMFGLCDWVQKAMVC